MANNKHEHFDKRIFPENVSKKEWHSPRLSKLSLKESKGVPIKVSYEDPFNFIFSS